MESLRTLSRVQRYSLHFIACFSLHWLSFYFQIHLHTKDVNNEPLCAVTTDLYQLQYTDLSEAKKKLAMEFLKTEVRDSRTTTTQPRPPWRKTTVRARRSRRRMSTFLGQVSWADLTIGNCGDWNQTKRPSLISDFGGRSDEASGQQGQAEAPGPPRVLDQGRCDVFAPMWSPIPSESPSRIDKCRWKYLRCFIIHCQYFHLREEECYLRCKSPMARYCWGVKCNLDSLMHSRTQSISIQIKYFTSGYHCLLVSLWYNSKFNCKNWMKGSSRVSLHFIQ